MTIQLISAAGAIPVLLSEVRDFLKITHQEEDALIASYIRAATDVCENFTGRKLIRQQWQMILNDWPADSPAGAVQIPLSPLLSVDRIEVWRDGLFEDVAPENYLLDTTSYQAKVMLQAGFVWRDPTREVAGIKITVSAGFGDDHNDLPHDMRLGILHWVAAAYDGDQAGGAAEKLWQPYRRVGL